jgi:hypothetical protein
MAQFWVGDDKGRMLGPATLEALAELVARGRLPGLCRASTDGQTWKPLAEVPELRSLLAPPAALPPKRPADPQAVQLAREVARLRALSAREQLGVPATATVEQCRAVFFDKVRPFHPSRLAPDASAALRGAWQQMFELLRAAMTGIEAAASAPAPSPTYAPAEFVGWLREGDEVKVELELGLQDAHLFTDLPVASLATGGFFLPTRKALPLFQAVEVILRFKAPRREIRGRGRVVADCTQRDPAGLGIKLSALGDEDRRFLQYLVKKAGAWATGSPRSS